MARDGGQIIDTPIVPENVKADGAGPAITLLHGFGAAIDWWDDVAPALATGHRVIRIDLIGHGGTAAPTSGYSIERQAALVSAILEKLGVDRVTFIGHSISPEPAKFFECVPSGKVPMIEGAGHSPMVERPPQTLELIRSFLAQSESPCAGCCGVPDNLE
jgi:pimeloyl-ACP methyl ester carboxylesterase